MKDVVRYAKVSEIMRREWERINAIIVRSEEEQRYLEHDRALYARDVLNGIWISLGSEVEVCVDGVHGKQDEATDQVRSAYGLAGASSHRQYRERDDSGRTVFTTE